MSFQTVYLDIEKEKAHETILRSVDGIHSRRVNDSIEYLMGGMVLAILSEANLKSGAKTRLRYQTSVLTPALAHGRPKAGEIKAAVDSYRISQ